ncbi:DUF6348 family protein [Kitasatospora sp. NPDC088134]|uniref:DUF6348 family protein n=1 Tax=Kitasatospora sp. NPDC088134 TaxID=3364071 RepID=UPI00380997AC
MSWIRRRTNQKPPDDGRLPDLEFLALVRDALEEIAPGVTEGARLKGNSLMSPAGWAVGVLPPQHGGGRHYDLVAVPDVHLQPDVPCFVDCVVGLSADPRDAAASWAQTGGACLLELVHGDGRFAERAGSGDAHGVAGWDSIVSGVVAFGVDPAENRRLQRAVLAADVLPRIVDSFAADLEAPYFNGVKVFYGGRPGAVQAEVRVNGEHHEAATAALAALGLPEPAAFAAVRYFALLLPATTGTAGTAGLAEDGTGPAEDGDGCCGACSCGGRIDPERPGFLMPEPHPIAELPPGERAERVRVDTGAVMVADGIGNFLKVRLPIPLADGRTVNQLLWVELASEVIAEVSDRARAGTLAGHRFEGELANGPQPWGPDLLGAHAVLAGQPPTEPGGVGVCEIVASEHPLLSRVIAERWPAAEVLGDRDPRLH